MRLVTLLLLLISVSEIAAGKPNQIIPSDLEVGLSAIPSTGLLTHQMFQITVSVTNHGLVPIQAIGLGSSTFSNEFALRFASNDCNLFLAVLDGDDEVSHLYLWFPNRDSELSVGQTKSCHINLALSLDARQVVPFSFSLPSEYLDPDPRNDSATIYLQRVAAQVPASSLFSKTLLIILLLVSAVVVFMRGNVQFRGAE